MPVTYKIENEEVSKEIFDKHKKELTRKFNRELIVDFVKFLNERYYPINDDEVMEKQINKFLDERNK